MHSIRCGLLCCCYYSDPTRGADCDEHVCLSICVCVCLSVHDHISWTTRPIFANFLHVTYSRRSVLLQQRSDTLRISSFVNDVIYAHKLIGSSMCPSSWGSEAHLYATLSLAHRNTHCGQRTLVTTSCSRSQGLLDCSGHVEYLLHHACTQCPCMFSDKKMTCA